MHAATRHAQRLACIASIASIEVNALRRYMARIAGGHNVGHWRDLQRDLARAELRIDACAAALTARVAVQ